MATRAREKIRRPVRRATAVPSHVTGSGRNARSRMVDVSAKAVTTRTAVARARIHFPSGDAAQLLARGGKKGPITEVARAAGVLAAKRTAELIPLCHTLGLDAVDVEFVSRGARAIEVRCTAICTGKTGVEMEALLGAAIASLTVYDMTKAVDHGISIERIELVEKSGGRSGHWKTKRRA
jgi:cyclic pyranopterin phosphate synthase